MIKLEKVNKYFNRFKRNQIHVINKTSLEIGDNGLVAILGDSGSRENYTSKCNRWIR